MALTTLSKRWFPSMFWADDHTDDSPWTLSRRWDVDFAWGSPLERDATPPSITANVPAGVITHDVLIQVSCSDTGGTFDALNGIAHFSIWVEHPDGTEMVFDGTSVADSDFGAKFAPSGDVNESGNGFVVDCRYFDDLRDGWPWSSFTLRARAVDANGNIVDFSRAYTVAPNYQAAAAFAYLPVTASTIDFDDSIRIDVTKAAPDEIQSAVIVADYAGNFPSELIFDGAPGAAGEDGFSVTRSVIANGRRWTITRLGDVGWPSESMTISVVVTTKDPVTPTQSGSVAYDVNIAPVEVGDTVPPVVDNVAPTPGTPLEVTTPLTFDVTDETAQLRRILVTVRYAATGVTEVAHDGDQFLGGYAQGSSREAIAGGYAYSIIRDGGWPSSPTLRVFAFDQGGNEA